MRQERKSAESRLGLPEYRGHSLAEKTAFAALALFVGAAAGGAFGGGPASEAEASSEGGELRIQYQRLLRRDSSELLHISMPTTAGVKEVELTLDAEYLRRAHITEVFPEPKESISHGHGTLRFETDGSGRPIEAHLYYQARLPGFMTGEIAVASGAGPTEQARIKQFVYP